MSKPRLVVIGWDGATFDFINPLAAQGRLPNIARLMQEGSWGPCRSTIPPLTPCAWTSISTGVNPGQHGIFDAFSYRPQERRNVFINSTLRRRPPLWVMLSRLGLKVGALNIPMTWPPDRVNGFVIPGMFTPPGLKGFMHPPELEDEIGQRFGPYRIECDIDPVDPENHLKMLLEMTQHRVELALHLLERFQPDFFFPVFIAVDRIQHFAFQYLDLAHPQHDRHKDIIARVYEDLDRGLGRLLEAIGPQAHVMMISDHGAGPVRRSLVLANWLRQKGYLRLKTGSAPGEGSLVKLSRRIQLKLLTMAGSPKAQKLRNRINTSGINRFLQALDWEQTLAFSEGATGSIYLNRDAVKPQDEPALLERLRRDLYQIRDEQGNRVVEEVLPRREVYSGPAVEEAPDLVVLCAPGWIIKQPSEFEFFGEKMPEEIFTTQRWSGRHEMNGIFLAAGPGIRPGQVLGDCQVMDLAPTALYLLGQPIPQYMDGRLLTEALDPALLAQRPPVYAASDDETPAAAAQLSPEEEAQVAERLRDLGYIE